ncbi:predicted protein [Verticillium alfalfae VaMs.102]|uniref:Predicted protein n=1 Tax=Verticillium alfalfae (strain VaMs.102 / ATCC MYA-4576 / FGSC 10136) TaxID=526221 RepID=C9SEN4_VERA1|nr:predicted protein [Verticillium alfalfae VaMs.102]EEY16627.1 predicted protein [Verticillium alfalfae VaMs.102]
MPLSEEAALLLPPVAAPDSAEAVPELVGDEVAVPVELAESELDSSRAERSLLSLAVTVTSVPFLHLLFSEPVPSTKLTVAHCAAWGEILHSVENAVGGAADDVDDARGLPTQLSGAVTPGWQFEP